MVSGVAVGYMVFLPSREGFAQLVGWVSCTCGEMGREGGV